MYCGAKFPVGCSCRPPIGAGAEAGPGLHLVADERAVLSCGFVYDCVARIHNGADVRG